MDHTRKLQAAGVVIAMIFVLLAFATGIISLPSPQTPGTGLPLVTVTRSTCGRPPEFILIIADLSGFNGSMNHGAPVNPWPVIHVHEGDVVRLLVCNKDTTQPHGFAIGTYLDAGVALMPGEAYRIVFTATIPGTFVIYCNIFCTVHVFMVARLIVST